MWSSSLCACCDGCVCCCACILPCLVLAQNVHRMQEVGIKSVMDDYPIQNKPCAAGTLYFAGVAANFVGSMLSSVHPYFGALTCLECGSICLHAQIRDAIVPHPYVNFWIALCCYSCALAQEQRHLDTLTAYHQQDTFVTENTMLS